MSVPAISCHVWLWASRQKKKSGQKEEGHCTMASWLIMMVQAWSLRHDVTIGKNLGACLGTRVLCACCSVWQTVTINQTCMCTCVYTLARGHKR